MAGNTGIVTLVTHYSQTSGTRVMRIEDTSESDPHSPGGYSPTFWVGDVLQGSQNPDPISDQNV